MILSSLDKHLKIFDLLANYPKGLTISTISEYTRQPISSLHHALSTFKAHGYIFQHPETKKYSLGFKFITLGRKVLLNFDIKKKCHPFLEKLSQVVQEMTLMSILRQDNVIYIDKINFSHKLVQDIEIGQTAKAFTCTSGKALLSSLSDEQILKLYPDEILSVDNVVEIEPIKQNLVSSRTKLLEELNQIRKQGYYLGEELHFYGVRAVAVPIAPNNKLACSICITGSSYSMTEKNIQTNIIPNILKCKQELTKLLSKYI